MFKFTLESTNKKIKFLEILLGNEKRTPKAKKAKEISNGSLEEKPNNKYDNSKIDNDENVVIIETEE